MKILDRYLGSLLIFLLSIFNRKGVSRPVRKILIIKLAAVGDTILFGTIAERFKEANKDVEIHWLVSRINVEMASLYPSIDRFIVWPNSILSFLHIIRNVRHEGFDAVIDGEQWARGTALLTYFSRAPLRIGFAIKGNNRHLLYTKTLPKYFNKHELQEFHDLFFLVCPFDYIAKLSIHASNKGANESAGYFLNSSSKRKVVLHPGCGKDGIPREWPLENYAVLGHWLLKNYSAELFITGGHDDAVKCEKLGRLLNGKAENLGGQMSIEGLVAFFREVNLLISGNTGIMHIAAAWNIPQIALHGPTDATIWGPINSQARIVRSSCQLCPCLRLGYEYHRHDDACMRLIEVDEVKTVLRDIVDKKVWI